MSRLRPYWVAAVVVAAVFAIAVVALVNQPMFHPKTVAVSGLARVTRDEVLARAAIDPSANVWLLNKSAIETRIDAIPYVRTATVHRRPLADVSIAIDERDPSDCVRDPAGRIVTIDADNRILQDDCIDDALLVYEMRVPVDEPPGAYIRKPELARLEADARTLSTPERRFRSYGYDRFGQLVAMTTGGVAIEFGDEDDLDRKQRLIGPIFAQVGARAPLIKTVDLRAPATPVVEFKAPIHTIYTRKSTVDHNI